MTPKEMDTSAEANLAEDQLLDVVKLRKRFEEGSLTERLFGEEDPFSKSRAAPLKAVVPPASAARRAK